MNYQNNNTDVSFLNDNFSDSCITLYIMNIMNMKYLRDGDGHEGDDHQRQGDDFVCDINDHYYYKTAVVYCH